MRTDVIIQENERGLLYKDGKLTRWLDAGRHTWWNFGSTFEVRKINLDGGYTYLTAEIERLLPKNAGELATIESHEIAILEIDNRPHSMLRPGRYILWTERFPTKLHRYDLNELFLEIPEDHRKLIANEFVNNQSVLPYQQALLYVNGKLEKTLDAGNYALSVWRRKLDIRLLDLREQEIQIVGQEVMTRDKVSLRLNLIIKYKIHDAQRSVESVDNLYNAIYSETQMIARSFIAGHTVDELLESRVEIATSMRAELEPRSQEWGVQIVRTDIKDIVLPGEMKQLLNRVIEAEKEAAANNILRREETAATRSLANTAKMLERNPTLLRLKELETWKEIAGKVQKLTLITNTSDLSNLLSISPNNASDDE
ncbi:MAG: slipin family protein [Myxococcales bacterium]|nr:slipin family protein [Myxococcales bacterium]MCB9642691.1 slipin family protein [Myxococcales bacterium]